MTSINPIYSWSYTLIAMEYIKGAAGKVITTYCEGWRNKANQNIQLIKKIPAKRTKQKNDFVHILQKVGVAQAFLAQK